MISIYSETNSLYQKPPMLIADEDKTSLSGAHYREAGLTVLIWSHWRWFRSVWHLEIKEGEQILFFAIAPEDQIYRYVRLFVLGLERGKLSALDETCWQEVTQFLAERSHEAPVFNLRYQHQRQAWVAEIQAPPEIRAWHYQADTIAAAVRGVIHLQKISDVPEPI